MAVKRRVSPSLAQEAVFGRLRKPTCSRVPIPDHRSALPKASMATPYGPLTDPELFVRWTAQADRFGGRADSIIGMMTRLKRIMDVFLSSVALLFLWPLMLLIGIAIKLESRGPAIYRSLRAGKGGREFDCYKFRTMVSGADGLREKLGRLNQRRGPFFKIADDPRVTRLGRLLRKFSFDELPQFWNVLKGDMSLVGPRPHPVEDCVQYAPGDFRRLDVTPGLTGLWQVLARSNPSFEVCMLLDLAYIEKWSLLLDFWILLKTVPAVFAGEGQ